MTGRVRPAFDVEKVTKRFYDRFSTELTAFGGFINGITAQGDRDWYASLMLNRMMFVYFVQKQGFLDDDTDYLRNRLSMVRNQSGGGRFQQFYRIFLLRLFHEGLGRREADRAPDLAVLLGKVPFLNGGLFDQHELERDNPDISIPDEAFEQVFEFFDGYRWHLDERPGREDNEINPDVLGYIFEKYVNQKQMGAYYTKEDITGYISRNTVVPFLFDAARKECPVAFGPDGGVWRLLRDDADRYIYPAVGQGITWNARQVEDQKPLDIPFELPDNIAVGISDMSKRGGWNAPAPDDYALPTETWREVVARRTNATPRSPRQARVGRGAECQRPHHAEPRHRAFRQRRHCPERRGRAPARLLAFHAGRIGSSTLPAAPARSSSPPSTSWNRSTPPAWRGCAASWTTLKGLSASAALSTWGTFAAYWSKWTGTPANATSSSSPSS